MPIPERNENRVVVKILVTGLELLTAGTLVYLFCAFGAVWLLLHAVRRPVRFTPRAYDVPFQPVSFFSLDGETKLLGWHLRHAELPKGFVVLAHDYRQTKSDLLPLAAFLYRNGWDCLLFDFRAHGESEGTWSGLGLHESRDLLGALQFVREMHLTPDGKTAVVGVGLGAVAALLAAPKSENIVTLVCDSAYPDLFKILDENFAYCFHGIPKQYFQKVCLFFLEKVGTLKPGLDNPKNVIGSLGTIPTLFVHGEHDFLVTTAEAERFYQACPASRKEFWVVPGAGRAEGLRADLKGYQTRILRWLEARSLPLAEGQPLPEDFVEVAVAVVVSDGKVLISRRMKGTHLEGFWEFPGGKLEPGEPPQLGVIREVREEVNLEVIVEKQLATLDHDYRDRRVRLHFFKCRVHRGEPKPIRCGEVRWISREEIDRVRFPQANKGILAQVKQFLA